jgi:hypothetical protein
MKTSGWTYTSSRVTSTGRENKWYNIAISCGVLFVAVFTTHARGALACKTEQPVPKSCATIKQTAFALLLIQNAFVKVNAQAAFSGDECVTTDDCWDGRACLGGKCCDFSESDRNNSWNYYDQHLSWGRGNCTACGGKQADDTMDAGMIWMPDGACTACAQGTQLIEYGAGYMNGFYNQEGMCAPICSSTQYLTNNRCEDKRSPGQHCDGWCTGDNCHEAKAFELASCSSGLCGYQYCCDEQAVTDGCSGYCDSDTGACSTKVAQGDECVTTDDCWDGRACLGGKCCDFSESDRNNSWNYYDQHLSWGRGNCTACGGKQADDTMDAGMIWMPDGACTACAQGTQLIEYGAGYMNGFYNQEGMCAPICSSTQYLTNNRCEDKRSPGQHCDGWCTGDNCHEAKAFELASCSSGLCGYQYCCDEAAVIPVNGECCLLCASHTGECISRGACPSHPPPPPPPPMSLEELVSAAEEKTELAEVSRDAFLADIGDAKTKAKAKLLADAVIAGVKVKKVAMAFTAESDDAACTQAFSMMRLDASLGACDVAVSSSRRRRLVADTAYDVTVFVNPATVDETTFTMALENLAAEGVTVTSTETDPTEELRLIPGIDASSLESFVADAAVAADATSVAREAETQVLLPPPPPPPPPSPSPSPPPLPPPPPNRLIFGGDYESSATRYSIVTALVVSIINLYITTKSR